MSKNYLSSWGNISVRIKSILSLINDLKLASDDRSINEVLSENTISLFQEIYNFRENFENVIPKAAFESLDNFLTREKKRQQGIFNAPSDNFSNLKIRFGLLASLESEVSYFLNDTQSNILKAVEVAFAHLQRRIVADKFYKKRWNISEDKNIKNTSDLEEVTFEKLGADHLLFHRIWAFKANSAGERTDLILGQTIDEKDPLYASADGLVLTEWKVVRNKKYEVIIETAKKQAAIYKFGSLYPLELSNYCFLVIISEKNLQIPYEELNFTENGVKFRVINIAYDPDEPNDAAKK
jgi:hypothetical protein